MSPAISSYSGGTADVLLEKLEDPRILGALVSLLDKADKVASFADGLEHFLRRSEGMLESVSQSVYQVGRTGTTALKKSLGKLDLDDLKSASSRLQGMLPLLRDLAGEFAALKEAGFFDPEVVQILGRTGRAMAATVRDPKAYSTDTRGIFSLLGVLKDPDVARTLNFVISFARHLGGNLSPVGSGSANALTPAAAEKSPRKNVS